jgi:hypothetical protein
MGGVGAQKPIPIDARSFIFVIASLNAFGVQAWQSRPPTRGVGECVGEANLGSQTKGLRTALAKPISTSFVIARSKATKQSHFIFRI